MSGSVHHLAQHLGNPETTIVAGERYLSREPGAPASERVVPDLLIAFHADPDIYRENNGYIISEQAKPPDFVLEIASRSTGQQDAVEKRAGLRRPENPRVLAVRRDRGVPRDPPRRETGWWMATGTRRFHVETVEEGVLQGYSRVLNLHHPVGPRTAGLA